MNFIQNIQGDIFAIGSGLTWSIAIIFFRIAGQKVDVISFNVFKNTLGFILMAVFMVLLGETAIPTLSTNQWIRLIASSFCGVALAEIFVVLALNKFGAGLMAIGNCLYAPTIMLVAFVLLGQKMTLIGLLGSSFVLSAIVIGSKSKLNFKITPKDIFIGFVYLWLAHLFNALGVLGIFDMIQTKSLLWLNTFRFGVGTLMLFTIAVFMGRAKAVARAFRVDQNFIVMTLAGIFGPFLSTIMWFAGYKYTLAGKAAIYNQLSSIWIMLWASIFLKEPITRNRFIAIILAFIGAVIVGWG